MAVETPSAPDVNGDEAAHTVDWREIRHDFWVGRTDAGFHGSIEHGSRYVATDGLGRTMGRYPTFDAAAAAIREGSDRAPSPVSPRAALLATVATVAMLATGAIAVFALALGG